MTVTEVADRQGFSAAMGCPYGCNQRTVAGPGIIVQLYNQPGQ